MTHEHLIRLGTSTDLAAIRDIEQSSATSAHWAEADYDAIFTGPLRRVLLVATTTRTESETVIGFLVGRVIAREWEVENVVVSNLAQRRGIGRALLQRFISLAEEEGAVRVILEVRESNVAARALYQNCRFSQNGIRPGYYSKPAENAVLYQLLCKPKSLKIR